MPLRDPPTVAVRSRVKDIFEEMGARVDQAVDEAILIKNGHYCGRRFLCDGVQVVWFVEENQLKLYDRDGSLLCVRIALPEPEILIPRAA
jgi:hypothetical protein